MNPKEEIHPMPEKQPHSTLPARGFFIALVSSLFLSTTAIFIRYLTQTFTLPALILAFWRDFFVALTLIPALAILRPALLRVERSHLAYLVIYGLALACFNSFWTLSVALNGAAVATVLVYCSAGFTVLLGWRLLKERLGLAKIAAVVVSLSGCVLVADALNPATWNANLLGILTGVLAGLLYAVYSLMGRSAAQRGINPWSTLLYTFSFAALFLFLVNQLPNGWLPGTASRLSDFLWLGSAFNGWIVLFLLAAVPTVAGFGLYNVSLSLLPSGVANLILTSEPVFTAVIAFLLFGERLTSTQLMGSVMVLGGVVILRLFEK